VFVPVFVFPVSLSISSSWTTGRAEKVPKSQR